VWSEQQQKQQHPTPNCVAFYTDWTRQSLGYHHHFRSRKLGAFFNIQQFLVAFAYSLLGGLPSAVLQSNYLIAELLTDARVCLCLCVRMGVHLHLTESAPDLLLLLDHALPGK
jgi:hypothetical protein